MLAVNAKKDNSTGLLRKVSDVINKKICRITGITYKIPSASSSAVTEVIKDGNKTLGGYSICIEYQKKNAHVGFIALDPQIHGSKSAYEYLLALASRMCENAKLNGVETITGDISKHHSTTQKLFKRLGAVEIGKIGSIRRFSANIQEFEKNLNKTKLLYAERLSD